MPCLVYIIAKAPRPGEAKTRLCPPLTATQAARLATAFVSDAVDTVRSAGFVARMMCRSPEDAVELRQIIGDRCVVSVQDESGLGAALESAFVEGFRDGASSVAILGADSPVLPPALIQQAFALLGEDTDVVIGPSDDGGYYLLAARCVHSSLFRSMNWSTSLVFHETLRRCAVLNLKVRQLPSWYDVDDGASLDRLCNDLANTPGIAEATRHELEGQGLLAMRRRSFGTG